jgi:hypothetical protein
MQLKSEDPFDYESHDPRRMYSFESSQGAVEADDAKFQPELVEADQFIPLPRQILSLYRQVHNASYMGILPEINRAWITIDNRLYLWNYENPEQYTEYEGLDDSDVIVSVALSAPKPGIFLDNIQYVLVVATLSEVCLFAVTKDSRKLLRTAYSVPSEGVIYKAAGSQAGMVFLAGSDGSLSELDYSADQSIWSLLDLSSGSSSSSSSSSSDRAKRGGRDSCRLVRHGHWDSSLLRFVPAFMRPPETALELRDALSEAVVDNFRQILYCVSGQGSLSAFHTHTLQQGRGKKQLRRVGGSGKVFAVLDMARMWLEQSLGLEGYATDKGKQPQQGTEEEEEEHSSRGRLFKACFAAPSSSTPLRVVGLHVLSPVESADVHAVLTANNGTRVLLQLRSAQGNAMDTGSQDCPSSVAVVAVYPPPASIPATSGSSTGRGSSGALDGFVHRTFSASGVFIAASIASRSNCSALLGAVHSTRVLPVTEHKGSDTDEDEEANNSGEEEEKEGSAAAGVVGSSSRRGSSKQSRQGSRQELIGSVPAPLNSVVRDIKEDCRAYRLPASDLLQRALLTSNTTTTNNTTGAGGSGAPLGVNHLSLAPSLRGGDTNSNSNNQQSHAHAGDVLRPGELDLQCYMHPSRGGLGQRRFLCLESQGMHVLVKQRPVDRVLGVLTGALPLPEEEAAAASHHQQQRKGQSSRIGFGFGSDPLDREIDRSGISKVSTSTRAVRALVDQYGAVEFVCMCVALGCGLPADARLTTQRDVSALVPTEENLSDPQQFREHILPAFLATTHLLRGPALSPVLSQQQGGGAPVFVPSQLSDGIVLFLSRALRPLWGQPMLTPARVNNNKPSLNALWNPDVLSAALAPLEALQVMLEQYFPHSLGTVPRTAAQREELLRRHSSESNSGSNSDSSSSYSAANVARELEHSHLACVYRLVARCRELVHVLLLVVTWQQQQQHILHNCVNELRVAAAEAAEKGIVDPLSMPLALRRDQLARRVERRKALAGAFDWPQLAVWAADATFSTVATDHEHAAQFTSVLRLGLHEVCVVEQEQGQEPDSQAVALVTEEEHEQPLGANGLAESIASCASGYFTEADLHEFAAFRLLHNHLSTTASNGNTRPAEGEAVLPPALAGHLLAAAESWSTLGSVRDRAGQDSLLGAHAALLSDVGSDDALELAVQLCLAAARNFLPPSAPADNNEVTEAAAARLEQGALACYSHLITLVCTTSGISLNQRAGMLMIAIEDQWLGGDPRLLETVCAGLRGRFTDDLLLNLPSEYVSQYLRRNDRSLLFQWHCRREEFEEACAVALEQAFQDDGSPIALRVGHLKDALSVVPEAEHATVSRMLNFALIQYDAYLKLLSGTAGATFDIKPSGKESTTAEDAAASPASGGRSRTYYYRDASPSPSQKMKHKAARGSPSPGPRGANTTTSTTDSPDNSPGALIRARGDTQELEHARYRLGFTLISEGEWYQDCFFLVRGLHLWEAALCLLVLLDVDQLADPGDGEALMVRLWKSFIYRLVPTRSRDGAASQAGQFLAKQRQISEIDIDPHEQLGGGSGSGSSSGVMFEDYQKWLPGLQSAIQHLCQRIDGAGTNGSSSSDEEEQQQESENNHASLPMAPLLAELEAIATELDVMQSKQVSGSGYATASLSQSQHGTLRGWVPDALLAVNVRPINVVRAYVNLFWSVGRGFAPEKIIKLLESLSYVLLEWLRASTADRIGSLPSTRDLRGAVGSRELDNWVDAFRHQLSDMSGRVSNEHSKAALGRVALEFQQLLRLIDEFAFE